MRTPTRADTLPALGRPARRDSEYLRHGTQNLFCALQVHRGRVFGRTCSTRNQLDFIASWTSWKPRSPPTSTRHRRARQHLATHKTAAVSAWLGTHPRWRFVVTPKHASWLNQVEVFFSVLARRLLRHGQFTGPDEMLAFVEHYNLTAQRFAWTTPASPSPHKGNN